MTSLKKLELALLAALEGRLSPLGFPQFKRGTNRSRRTEPFGQSAYHVAVPQYFDHISPSIDVAMRYDAVEEIANELENQRLAETPEGRAVMLSETDKRQTCTIGTELGNYAEGQIKCWEIYDATQIDQAADEMVDMFQRVGIPFIERYSNREALLAVLREENDESQSICPFPSVRAKRAVVLEYVMNGREAATRLAGIKMQFLRKHHKRDGLKSFLDFVRRADFIDESAALSE